MAIVLPLIFFVLSCMDWGGWWGNVTPTGRGKLFVIGCFAASLFLAAISGTKQK